MEKRNMEHAKEPGQQPHSTQTSVPQIPVSFTPKVPELIIQQTAIERLLDLSQDIAPAAAQAFVNNCKIQLMLKMGITDEQAVEVLNRVFSNESDSESTENITGQSAIPNIAAQGNILILHNCTIHNLQQLLSNVKNPVPNIPLLTKQLKDSYNSLYHSIPRVMAKLAWLPIKTCFIRLAIIERKEQIGKEKKKLAKQINSGEHTGIYRSYEDIYVHEEKKLIPVKDVFKKVSHRRSPRVLVIGRAGIGKSTASVFASFCWAEGNFWDQYKLVFYIKARNLKKDIYKHDVTLAYIIQQECFSKLSTIPSEKDINILLESYPKNNILIMLDGFDELTKTSPCYERIIELIKRPLNIETSAYSIIVFTRPFTDLCENDFDEVVECMGFLTEDIQKFVRLKEVWPNPKSKDALKPEEISSRQQLVLEFFKESYSIHTLMHVPILLDMFCAMCVNSMPILKNITITELLEKFINHLWTEYDNRQKIIHPELTEKELDEKKKKARMLLRLLAVLATHNNVIVFGEDLINRAIKIVYRCEENDNHKYLQDILEPGLLYSSDGENYYYPHLIFQEFFMAEYIRDIYIEQVEFTHSVIKDCYQSLDEYIAYIKHHKNYENILAFLAGLLKLYPQLSKRFFEAITGEPKDIIGHYSKLLLMRCVNEYGIEQAKKYLNKIASYIVQAYILADKNYYNNGRSKLDMVLSYLRQCSQLMHANEIKDAIIRGTARSNWNTKIHTLAVLQRDIPFLANDNYMREQVAYMLFDPDGDVQLDAVSFLKASQIEMPLADKIAKRLKYTVPEVQMLNIIYLVKLHTPNAIVLQVLRETIKSTHDKVRQLSAIALGMLGVADEQVLTILDELIITNVEEISVGKWSLKIIDALSELNKTTPAEGSKLCAKLTVGPKITNGNTYLDTCRLLAGSENKKLLLVYEALRGKDSLSFVDLAHHDDDFFVKLLDDETCFSLIIQHAHDPKIGKKLKQQEQITLKQIENLTRQTNPAETEIGVFITLLLLERYELISSELMLKYIFDPNIITTILTTARNGDKCFLQFLFIMFQQVNRQVIATVQTEHVKQKINLLVDLFIKIFNSIPPSVLRLLTTELLAFLELGIHGISICIVSILISISHDIPDGYTKNYLKQIYHDKASDLELKNIVANVMHQQSEPKDEISILVKQNLNSPNVLIRTTAAIVSILKRENIRSALPILKAESENRELPAQLRFKMYSLLVNDRSFFQKLIENIDFSLNEFFYDEFYVLLSKQTNELLIVFIKKRLSKLQKEEQQKFIINFLHKLSSLSPQVASAVVNSLISENLYIDEISESLNKFNYLGLELNQSTLVKLKFVDTIPIKCLRQAFVFINISDLYSLYERLYSRQNLIVYLDEKTMIYQVISNGEVETINDLRIVQMLTLIRYITKLSNMDVEHTNIKKVIWKIMKLSQLLELELTIILPAVSTLSELNAAEVTNVINAFEKIQQAKKKQFSRVAQTGQADISRTHLNPNSLTGLNLFEYLLTMGICTYEEYLSICFHKMSYLYNKGEYHRILSVAQYLDFDEIINFFDVDQNNPDQSMVVKTQVSMIIGVTLIKVGKLSAAEEILSQLLFRLFLSKPSSQRWLINFSLPTVNWFLVALQNANKFQLLLDIGKLFNEVIKKDIEYLDPTASTHGNDFNNVVFFLLLFHAAFKLGLYQEAAQYLADAFSFDMISSMSSYRIAQPNEYLSISRLILLNDSGIEANLGFYHSILQLFLSNGNIDQNVLLALFACFSIINSNFGNKTVALWAAEIAREKFVQQKPNDPLLQKIDDEFELLRLAELTPQFMFSFFANNLTEVSLVELGQIHPTIPLSPDDKQLCGRMDTLLNEAKDVKKTITNNENNDLDETALTLIERIACALTKNLEYSEELMIFIDQSNLQMFSKKYNFICSPLKILCCLLSTIDSANQTYFKDCQSSSLTDKFAYYIKYKLRHHIQLVGMSDIFLLESFCNEFLVLHQLSSGEMIYILNHTIKQKYRLPVNFNTCFSNTQAAMHPVTVVNLFSMSNHTTTIHCHQANNGLFALVFAVRQKMRSTRDIVAPKAIPPFVADMTKASLCYLTTYSAKIGCMLRNALYRSLLENKHFINRQQLALFQRYKVRWAKNLHFNVPEEANHGLLSPLLESTSETHAVELFKEIEQIMHISISSLHAINSALLANTVNVTSLSKELLSKIGIETKLIFIKDNLTELLEAEFLNNLSSLNANDIIGYFFLVLLDQNLPFFMRPIDDTELTKIRYLAGCAMIDHRQEKYWQAIYAEYAQLCLDANIQLGETELACLAEYWHCTLEVNQKVYSNQNPIFVHIKLNHLTFDAWQVCFEGNVLTNVLATTPSAYQIKNPQFSM